ncbi:MAG: hypothetical protein HW412_2072 [Bacteroidetes bacterium]|nr:hypothetical protein [Bacteroidota bacterium]
MDDETVISSIVLIDTSAHAAFWAFMLSLIGLIVTPRGLKRSGVVQSRNPAGCSTLQRC